MIRIQYKISSPKANSDFQRKVFGRICTKVVEGRHYIYYYKGLFDNVKVHRRKGVVFVQDDSLYERIKKFEEEFPEISFKIDILETKDLEFQTMREYWEKRAKYLNLNVKW